MNNLDTFNEFFDDVMNQKMSVHAFGMYAKGLIMNLQSDIDEFEEFYIHRNEAQRIQDKNTVAILEHISNLQATIEAQEIIIKDKSAIMEAMAQPKTCETCKHCITTHSIITSTPICGHDENIQFYLDDQPMQTSDGFYCNKYEPKVQP